MTRIPQKQTLFGLNEKRREKLLFVLGDQISSVSATGLGGPTVSGDAVALLLPLLRCTSAKEGVNGRERGKFHAMSRIPQRQTLFGSNEKRREKVLFALGDQVSRSAAQVPEEGVNG